MQEALTLCYYEDLETNPETVTAVPTEVTAALPYYINFQASSRAAPVRPYFVVTQA